MGKFKVGEKVNLVFKSVEGVVIGKDTFVITKATQKRRAALDAPTWLYDLQAQDKKRMTLTNIAESRLKRAAPTLKRGTKENEADPESSDFLLDTYNDSLVLYEMFGDDEYMQAAEEAKQKWSERYGKKQGAV